MADFATSARGQDALTSVSGATNWYATTSDKYPTLRVWGQAHNDVDKSGTVIDEGDIVGVRTTVIGTDVKEWSDTNGDGSVDVLDLVYLVNKTYGIRFIY